MAEIKFRDLTLDNAFDFCAVLDAIGTEQILGAFDAKEIAALTKSGKSKKEVGVMIAMKIPGILIKNLPRAKDEICTFFANCMDWDNGSAVTVDEVKKFKLPQFIRLMGVFFKKDDFSDFFGAVSELWDTVRGSSGNASTEGTEPQKTI